MNRFELKQLDFISLTHYKKLLAFNIHLNGLSASFYCRGLSSARFLEYSYALNLLSKPSRESFVLDVGTGRSILPTLLVNLGYQVIVLDINREGLKWQLSKIQKELREFMHPIRADARYLPVRTSVMPTVLAISSIEHIPNDGDMSAMREIGRVLKRQGFCVISFGLLTNEFNACEVLGSDAGIPFWTRKIFGLRGLNLLFEKLGTDRLGSHFERRYSVSDIKERIALPSGCHVNDYVAWEIPFWAGLIRRSIIIRGALTPFEYLMTRLTKANTAIENARSLVLTLKKADDTCEHAV